MWGKAPGPAELSVHKPKRGSVKTTAGTDVAETADEASGPKPFEVEDYDDDEYFVRL